MSKGPGWGEGTQGVRGTDLEQSVEGKAEETELGLKKLQVPHPDEERLGQPGVRTGMFFLALLGLPPSSLLFMHTICAHGEPKM